MKIALVHRYYPMQGGVTTVVRNLKDYFNDKKIKAEVITNMPCSEKNVKTFSGNSISFYFKAYKYLKSQNFDIIHAHSIPLCYFSFFLKGKIIFSSHGYDKIYDWPKNPFIGLIVLASIYLKGFGYRFVDRIVAVSNLVKEETVKNWKIKPENVEVIHNAVDAELFKPEKTGSKRTLDIFLYGTSKRKGFDKLIEWAPRIIKDVPNVKFIIIGKKEDLNKNIKDYFEFIDNISFRKMPEAYNSADLVLLPSLDEPFGLTAAEGMSCEKPVIVSDFSGIRDIIQNNKNGVISSFEDFPKNIIFLAKNEQKRKEMGKKARQTIIKDISDKVVGKKYLELYKKILKV